MNASLSTAYTEVDSRVKTSLACRYLSTITCMCVHACIGTCAHQHRQRLNELELPELQQLARIAKQAREIEAGEVLETDAADYRGTAEVLIEQLAENVVADNMAQEEVDEAEETADEAELDCTALIHQLVERAEAMVKDELIVLPVLFWRRHAQQHV